MSGEPSFEAYYGRDMVPKEEGSRYTNPFGNYTVVDTVYEDMLHLVDPHWYSFPPMNEMWYGLVGFFLVTTGILAIGGNLIVIYVFCCTKTLRSPANYFVVNLAISDFILMVSMCPPMLISSYYHTWVWGPFLCGMYGAVGSLTGCTSIFTMCLISLDRYNVIVKGIGGKPLTSGLALMEIATVWILSSVWTFAPFFGWGRYVPEGNMTACGTDYLSEDLVNVSYIYAYAAWVWGLPLSIIVYSYWFIVSAVVAHEKNMREQAKKMGVKSLRGDADANKKSQDCKLAKIAMVTISLWFMAWTPYLVINIVGLIDKSKVTPLFSIWGSVFAKANTVYNPIIYAISHPKYKAALYQKLPCLNCAVSADDEQSNDAKSNATATSNEEKA